MNALTTIARVSRPVALIAANIAMIAVSGCGTAKPIERWQARLTVFTDVQGHGDPNCIREAPTMRSRESLRPAQIRFNETDIRGSGISPYADRYDVNGVLVGQHGETFIFLVGVVRRPHWGGSDLKDVRLVSWNVLDGVHIWQQGPPDPEAIQTYLAKEVPCEAGAGTSPAYRYFPRPTDAFHMEIGDGQVITREENSGAQWHLQLQDPGIALASLQPVPVTSRR